MKPLDATNADPVGLCLHCRHGRAVQGRRSQFWFCERSRTDPQFPKYPRLPVLACAGYEPADRAEPDAVDPPR